MAKRTYANWLGKINVNAALKDLKNTKTVTDGLRVVRNLMTDVYAGVGNIGASDNDEAAVVKVLTAFKNKYNIKSSTVNNIINSWDSSSKSYVNAGGLGLEKRVTNDYNKLASAVKKAVQPSGQKPTQPNTSTTGGKGAFGGGGSMGGSRPSTKTNTNTNTNNSGTGSTGYIPNINTDIGTDIGTNFNTTVQTPVERPVYEGADAVAKAHKIDYNLANILADYNQRTNDYYDAATAEYEADRNRYVQSSNNYANRIMDEYLDSYANATPTAAGRGATAASALMTDLNTQSVNTANDLGMLQTVNNLNEARKAELIKNKYLAEQYYNDLGTYLSQVSTAQYGADVNKYVKAMDAYAQEYAADRALAESEARAASTKYAGLANASAYKASQAGSTSAWDRLYNYYLVRYNGNEKMASNAVINNLGNQKAGDNK